MLYQVRDQDGYYPSTDRFASVNDAVDFIKEHGDEDIAYFIVHVDGATIAIYFGKTVFVPRHKDHWTLSPVETESTDIDIANSNPQLCPTCHKPMKHVVSPWECVNLDCPDGFPF